MTGGQGSPLIIRSSDSNHCFAEWDRVLINMWLGEMTLQAAAQLLTVARGFVAKNVGQTLSCLSIVGSNAPPPAERVRVELAKSVDELHAAGVSHVWVAEGSQSRTALGLGVGLGVSPLRLEFAFSVYEAAVMIAPQLSSTSGRGPVLQSIVDQVRSYMAQNQP